MTGLYRGGDVGRKSVTWRIHRLVAGAFIPNPDGLEEVNHKDCDRTNNRADNLEWVSRVGNIAHSISAGRNIALANPNKIRKLTPEAVAIIRAEYREGTGGSNPGNALELAERFGVERGTIYKVAKGLTKIYEPMPQSNCSASADATKGSGHE